MKSKIFLLLRVLAVGLNSQAQRTPAMGWSFWNTFALDINEMELD